jgi:hypothetical protein
MSLFIEEAAAGVAFDGTTGKGEFLFPGVKAGDATQRAEVFAVSVQSDEVLSSMRVVLAPDLASANGTKFIQVLNAENVTGSQVLGCAFLVPQEWSLFCFAVGSGLKTLVVDWQKVTKLPRC